MALSDSVFGEDWTTFARDSVKSAFLARVRVDRVTASGTWDADTGATTPDTFQPLYQGCARIQKVARPVRRQHEMDAADNQVVRVQISLDLPDNEVQQTAPVDYQSNDRVTVLANDSDPAHVNEVFYVHSDATSSNAWVRTLVCKQNQKQGL